MSSPASIFISDDDPFGRITFHNPDAIKVCRGEYLPFPAGWTLDTSKSYCRVYMVENPAWWQKHYQY